MSKPKEIELHVGHFGDGTGAAGHIDEVKEARKVTKRVYDILKANKVPSTFFEDGASKNRTQNINALIKHHNADRDGLIVSIHFNAGGDGTKAIGTEVLYYSEKTLADKLAKAISDATGGGLKNRGSKERKDLGVLTKTYEPAVLIEVCFVNSSIDVAIYRRDFEKICQAIAKVLAAEIGYSIGQSNIPAKPQPIPAPTPIKKEEEEVTQFLNETGRKEIRELLKKARNKKYIPKGTTTEKLMIDPAIHTDAKIAKYSDTELLSYQAAIVNRTFE